MAINEVQASGLEYLALATELLQRARLADAEAGVWEAADLQWWCGARLGVRTGSTNSSGSMTRGLSRVSY